ncbi:hypothetical protein A33M_2349 [Rhodovulum sp. PH10]|nr:hypothetical protein A33M_2349 [Rhodovulum sp. PH10]
MVLQRFEWIHGRHRFRVAGRGRGPGANAAPCGMFRAPARGPAMRSRS